MKDRVESLESVHSILPDFTCGERRSPGAGYAEGAGSHVYVPSGTGGTEETICRIAGATLRVYSGRFRQYSPVWLPVAVLHRASEVFQRVVCIPC